MSRLSDLYRGCAICFLNDKETFELKDHKDQKVHLQKEMHTNPKGLAFTKINQSDHLDLTEKLTGGTVLQTWIHEIPPM